MNYSFINEYNSLPVHVASSAALGVGTYRVYMNSGSVAFTASDYGINRAFAIDIVNDTVFSAIQDREVFPVITQSYDSHGTLTDISNLLQYGGSSTGSSVLIGATIPAGRRIFGDYDHVSLTSGIVTIYGI